MLFRGVFAGAASGKLGAVVASHNRAGQYLRARVTPVGKVPSSFQQVIRNAVASLAAIWKTLTQVQRDAWGVYAANVATTNALGDTIFLTGQNWYIGSNSLRTQASLTLVSAAPTIFDRGDAAWGTPAFAMSGTAATLTLGSVVDSDTTNKLLVFQGIPYPKSQGKYFGSRRLCAVLLTATATAQTFTNAFTFTDTRNQCEYTLVLARSDGRYTAGSPFTFRP